jgi:hypothetical protein
MNLDEFKPMPPEKGPPLPIILDPYIPFKGYWPWYKEVIPVTKAMIHINTDPAGAMVSANGQISDVTPLTLTVDPGTYTILLHIDGYQDDTEIITVVAGDNKTINKTLTALPTTAKIHVNTDPAGALVIANGQTTDVTPITLTVDPGTYTIIMRLSGYEDKSVDISVAAGDEKTISETLTQKQVASGKGLLVVNYTVPKYTVDAYINTQGIGTCPVTVEMDPGLYHLVLSQSTYASAFVDVTVIAGQTVTIEGSLQSTTQYVCPYDGQGFNTWQDMVDYTRHTYPGKGIPSYYQI